MDENWANNSTRFDFTRKLLKYINSLVMMQYIKTLENILKGNQTRPKHSNESFKGDKNTTHDL
jgi:hypothetical protein